MEASHILLCLVILPELYTSYPLQDLSGDQAQLDGKDIVEIDRLSLLGGDVQSDTYQEDSKTMPPNDLQDVYTQSLEYSPKSSEKREKRLGGGGLALLRKRLQVTRKKETRRKRYICSPMPCCKYSNQC